MAIEYKIPITTVSGGNYIPVTTGAYALRVSPYSTNTFVGSHVANGVWNFGAVTDGIYQLFYSGDSWGTESQVANFGTRYISAAAADSLSSAKVSGTLQADTIAEYTSGAGVTIDGVLLKDSGISIDTLSEKTGGAGVTIDGVLNKDSGVTCSGASTFTGGVSVTTTAITSTVTPSGANDLTNKTYVDSLVPFKYWYGLVTGDATPTITKHAGNLGGEISVTRTSTGVFNLNSSALFDAGKTHITYAPISNGSTDCVRAVFEYNSTSLIVMTCYDDANAVTDKALVDVEIKVFP